MIKFLIKHISETNDVKLVHTHPARATMPLVSNFVDGRAVRPLFPGVKALREVWRIVNKRSQRFRKMLSRIWQNPHKALDVRQGNILSKVSPGLKGDIMWQYKNF